VHGGFWLLSDDEYQIGPAIAGNLVRDGVAVALVRYAWRRQILIRRRQKTLPEQSRI